MSIIERILNEAPKRYEHYKIHAIARQWPIPAYEDWLPIYLKVWGVPESHIPVSHETT